MLTTAIAIILVQSGTIDTSTDAILKRFEAFSAQQEQQINAYIDCASDKARAWLPQNESAAALASAAAAACAVHREAKRRAAMAYFTKEFGSEDGEKLAAQATKDDESAVVTMLTGAILDWRAKIARPAR